MSTIWIRFSKALKKIWTNFDKNGFKNVETNVINFVKACLPTLSSYMTFHAFEHDSKMSQKF